MKRRLKVVVQGAVQGVGFRPFVYRLATDLGLTGRVRNTSRGVFLEVEGPEDRLEAFLSRLRTEKPPAAVILSLEYAYLDPRGYPDFQIVHSEETGPKTVLILPDIATCPDCLRELFDPQDRRFRYPFINCTNCGPRFTILLALPYDRPNTTMRIFPMCPTCQKEYEDPRDRRFHAQPNACPVCGPQVILRSPEGRDLAHGDQALRQTVQALKDGKIVALKGLGGYQLLVDARNEAAVRELRRRKHREEKPFALMFPYLTTLRRYAEVTEAEARTLTGPEAPILLLQRRPKTDLAPSVAPENPYLGAMLPYTPLHHLLLHDFGSPLVCTSGNLSDEPIVTDDQEAIRKLGPLADLLLTHNRPIARHADDSVLFLEGPIRVMVRRARGFAPLPILLRDPLPDLLALGPHLKNTIALSRGHRVFLSQHIGDLDTLEARETLQRVVQDFLRLYEHQPVAVVSDAHPDYFTTHEARRMAEARGVPHLQVFHHHAHVAACMAENELPNEPVLGLSWDGTGYGTDGIIWGGEVLVARYTDFQRFASLRTFVLPGGEQAIREPWRIALALLHAAWPGDETPTPEHPRWPEIRKQRQVLRMLQQVRAPRTSSCGRLFDGLSALLGLRTRASYEGQAAMTLEWHLEPDSAHYPLEIQSDEQGVLRWDWRPMIREIWQEIQRGEAPGRISARFHNTLVIWGVEMARRAGLERVVLSGGCFQNRYLLRELRRHLQAEGFRVYVHQQVPPNDGGVALGQIVVAGYQLQETNPSAW